MKLSIGSTVCLMVLFVCQIMASNEEKLLTVAMDCQKSTGANESDMEELLSRDYPSTKPGKCMRYCIMEHLKVIVDGKVNMEACLEWVKGMDIEEDKLDTAKKIIEKCKSVTDPDRCEVVGKLYLCVKDGLLAAGLDPKKMF